jgi:putative transposase
MRLMAIIAIYPKPKTSLANKSHVVYPYWLKDVRMERPNQVWVSDITYLPMHRGFCYLVAIMD